MTSRVQRIVMLVFLCAVSSLAQAVQVPEEARFLTKWGKILEREPYQMWAVATVPQSGANQKQISGRRWNLRVVTPGFKDRTATWAAIKPVAIEAGWTIVNENPNGGLSITLRYNKGGIDAWANATTENDGSNFFMVIVEVAPRPITLTLPEPAATPEKPPAANSGNFAFLPPLPGSIPHSGSVDNTPMRLVPKGADQPEIVATGSVTRNYSMKGLSQDLYFAVYHDAFLQAGWSIEREAGTEVIIAHYSKKGRNIWAYLDAHGEEYSIQVGTEGAVDQMKTALASACHVALYGVLFDFNKSTLQPASDGILTQVSTLLGANAALNVEVQGHTDNVGTDAYNQTLSEARAKSVMTWLTQHGVAAARMTAKGYGKTMPIADNNSDVGRMKNRRVEIAGPRCKPQSK